MCNTDDSHRSTGGGPPIGRRGKKNFSKKKSKSTDKRWGGFDLVEERGSSVLEGERLKKR